MKLITHQLIITVTFSIFFSFIFFSEIKGQSLDNAIRLSTLEYTGTARNMGAGGAMVSLGADFSASAYNPAGLALIRRSEIAFTPVLYTQNTNSNWNGSVESDRFSNLQFSNVGLVISGQPSGSSSFTNFSFALGFNRLASFHRNLFSTAVTEGSILDRFTARGQGLPPEQIDDFEVGLAYDAFALIYDEESVSYSTDLEEGTSLAKEHSIRTTGSVNELFLSFAGNLQEKLMMGITLAVPIVSIEEDKVYKDEDTENANPIYRSFEFTDFAEVSGAGFQIKAGLIYRHSQALRFGMAVHSPGWYALSDEFLTSATYNYDVTQIPGEGIPAGPQTAESPRGLFDYNFTTPWRILGGMSYLINNSGFLSLDVEYLDYTSAQYNFTNRNSSEFLSDEREQNNEITNNLGTAVNLRIGGEWAVQTLRFRGGLQFIQSPFDSETDRDLIWSLGIGIRESDFFLDLGFQRGILEGAYNPYRIPGSTQQPLVQTDSDINRIALTAGFKF